MKKLIILILTAIFLTSGVAFGDKKVRKYTKGGKYQGKGYHQEEQHRVRQFPKNHPYHHPRGHAYGHYKHRHNDRYRGYRYRGHYRWQDWNYERHRHYHRYRDGRYHHDDNGYLMFSYWYPFIVWNLAM